MEQRRSPTFKKMIYFYQLKMNIYLFIFHCLCERGAKWLFLHGYNYKHVILVTNLTELIPSSLFISLLQVLTENKTY